MIKYALACDKGHQFESWFQSFDAFDKQAKRKLVACPACGSVKVEKSLMAPRLSGTKKKGRAGIDARPAEAAAPAAASDPAPVAIVSEQERAFHAKLKELRDHLTSNSDYVGGKFSEEARRMHFGEIEHRSIYGEASPEDAKALLEEGIEFHPLPMLPEERN